MNKKKYNAIARAYTGSAALNTMLHDIPADVARKMSGEDLGVMLTFMDKSFYEGKNAAGAEVYDSDPNDGAAWIDCLGTTIYWKKNKKEELVLSMYWRDSDGVLKYLSTEGKQ